MTKIEIISGFLGAGKTTLIRKFLAERDTGETVAIIENEFGEVGIDGFTLQQSGVSVREINAGCICCSLVGNFDVALRDLLKKYKPDRIIIEPSGVGKLSDIHTACREIGRNYDATVSFCATIVDVKKYMIYKRNFAEFYMNQIEAASLVLFSRVEEVPLDMLNDISKDIRRINSDVHLISTPWDQISANDIRNSVQRSPERIWSDAHTMNRKNVRLSSPIPFSAHHGVTRTGHTGHRHSAADVFSFWGVETPIIFTEEKLRDVLSSFADAKCGNVLRAKGIVKMKGELEPLIERWCAFDYVQEEIHFYPSKPDVVGKICVIGSELKGDVLAERFGV